MPQLGGNDGGLVHRPRKDERAFEDHGDHVGHLVGVEGKDGRVAFGGIAQARRERVAPQGDGAANDVVGVVVEELRLVNEGGKEATRCWSGDVCPGLLQQSGEEAARGGLRRR